MLDEAATAREVAYREALSDLEESRQLGAVSSEEYVSQLQDLIEADLRAQGEEGRALAVRLRDDLDEFANEVKEHVQAVRSNGVGFLELLLSAGGALLGGGGIAGVLTRNARTFATQEAARAAAELDRERDLRRVQRAEPSGLVTAMPSSAPMAPVQQRV